MEQPFEWNRQAFGGTEYMASNFRQLIAPSIPKLQNYLCLVVPGIVPHFSDIHKSYKEVIMWMHNTPVQFAPEHLDSLRNPKFLDKVKYFIAVSEFAKGQMVEQLGIEPEKVYVIPNAIHPLKYNPAKFNKTGTIKLINTSSPDRGLDVLFNAIPLIDEDIEVDVFSRFNPNEIPGFEFDKRINFYGFSPKATVAKHYEAANIHAYPSTYPETFCISQAEAMSAGLLCVTSDIGALPEVSGGLTNIYRYEDDKHKHTEVFAEQLTKAIKQIRSGEFNPDAQIDYINRTYSWQAIKQKWLEFAELI